MQRRILIPTIVLASTLTLVACNQGAPASSEATPSVSATTSQATTEPASSTPTAAASAESIESLSPAVEASAESIDWLSGDSESPNSANSELVVSAMRAGQHDDFDRVVLEFSGSGTPGWSARWTQSASTQGKGDPIKVAGKYQLTLIGTGVTMPINMAAGSYLTAGSLTPHGAGLREVYYDPTFEGQYQLILGTDSQQYRVFTLTNPTRLVVDIKHPQ